MKYPIASFASLMVSAACYAQTTIVNDTMSDLTRTDGPNASDVVWYVGGSGTIALDANGTPYTNTYNSGSDGKLTLSTGKTTGQLLGYFPSVSILDGQTLTASFTFSFSSLFTATGSQAFRFGLFDRNSQAQITSDGYGTRTVFSGYSGYSVMNPVLGSPTATMSIYEKSTLSTNLIGTPANYTALGTSTAPNYVQLTAGTNYTGTLTINRTGTTYSMGYLLTDGASYSRTLSSVSDASISATAFDTVAFLYGSNVMDTGGSFALDTFSVTVIPEPSSATVLFGFGAMGVVALGRRRRRALTS